MDRIVYFAALLLNIIQIGFAVYIAKTGYGHDVFWAFMLLIPPCASLIALHFGPDIEERRLMCRLRKAKLLKELESMEK